MFTYVNSPLLKGRKDSTMPEREPLRLPRLPHPKRPLPHPDHGPRERRVDRPDGAADALQRALGTSAWRSGLEAVVVADDSGMMVSSSPATVGLDLLAAVMPIVARGEARAKIRHRGSEREFSVCSMDIFGERLHVGALGGDLFARERELHKSSRAVARILA